MIYAAENKMEKLIHDPEQEVQVTIEIVNPDIFEAVAAKKKKEWKEKFLSFACWWRNSQV